MTKMAFLRHEAGLTQKELAIKAGVRPSDVSLVESLARKPWPRFRKKVSEALGCQESELFTPDGWPIMAKLSN